jgi:hypothetical protein
VRPAARPEINRMILKHAGYRHVLIIALVVHPASYRV